MPFSVSVCGLLHDPSVHFPLGQFVQFPAEHAASVHVPDTKEHCPSLQLTVAVLPSAFWTSTVPVDLSDMSDSTLFAPAVVSDSRTPLEALEAAAIASLYRTSVLGEMSNVGVCVWLSVEPLESADAIAPSPKVILTATFT